MSTLCVEPKTQPGLEEASQNLVDETNRLQGGEKKEQLWKTHGGPQ